MAKRKPSEGVAEEKPAESTETAAEATEKPRTATLEDVLGGILHQLAINNRILADIQAKVSPRASVAGLKAGPFGT